MRRTLVILICIMLILLVSCGSSNQETATNDNSDEQTTVEIVEEETETGYEDYLGDFENHFKYLGASLDEYGDAIKDSIGSSLSQEESTSTEEKRYKTHMIANWHYLDGNVTVIAKDNKVVRFEFDLINDIYLNGDDFSTERDYLKDKYGNEQELTEDIYDYYFDDNYFRLTRNKFIVGITSGNDTQ